MTYDINEIRKLNNKEPKFYDNKEISTLLKMLTNVGIEIDESYIYAEVYSIKDKITIPFDGSIEIDYELFKCFQKVI